MTNVKTWDASLSATPPFRNGSHRVIVGSPRAGWQFTSWDGGPGSGLTALPQIA